MTRPRKKGRNPWGSDVAVPWMRNGKQVGWRGIVEMPSGGDGKRRRKQFHGKDKSVVEKAMTDFREHLHGATRIKPENLTLQGYLERWLNRPSDRRTPQTLATYETKIRKYIVPKIGAIQLQSLRKSDVKDLYAGMYRDLVSGDKGRRAIRYTHSILHKALEGAVEEELIPKNPADKACEYDYSPRKMEVIEAKDLSKFVKTLQEDWLFPLYYTAILTGCRRGELCALQWPDVHLDRNDPYLQIEKSTQELRKDLGGIVHGKTKTAASVRVVPLPLRVAEVLREHKKSQEQEREKQGAEWNSSNMVFPSRGGEPIRPSLVTNHWRLVRERLGRPGVRFHDLRHSLATMLLEMKVPMKVIQEQLGHQDFQTTARTYTHVLPSMQEETRRLLDGIAPKVRPKSPKAKRA